MEHQKGIWFLLWGVFSVLFFFINLTTGIGGIVLTYYSEVSYLVPYYIQCSTAATSFALAVCETGLLICALHWRAKLREKTFQQESANNMALRSVSTPTSESEDMTRERGKGRYLTVYQGIQLFFSLLGCNIGLLLMFWSLTIVYNYQNTAWIEGKLWPFIVVDIILGIVVPSLIIGSVLIIMSVIREVTSGSIETRKLLPFIFNCMNYEKGNRESYWVVLDSFYYKIATRGLCYSSWAIYSMFIFTFFIPWCFLINGVVTTRYGIPGCSHLTDQTEPVPYCFVLNLGGYSNVYVNCTVNTSYSNQLFCFKFKRIGQDISPITYIIISIMMYYILITCISIIFRVTKELMSLASKKCWSGLMMSFGVFVFVIGVAIYGTSIYVHMNLNILTGFQIVVLCIDIILVGIVVLRGEPLAQNMPIATTCSRNSTDTLLSGTMSASNSDAPSQPNGYTHHHLTQHGGQTYRIGHQHFHSMGNSQDMRRGRNRYHNHRPFSRPTQQAIAERNHVFENLNRPTDKPPTPPPPQSLAHDSPASSSHTLPVAPSLTISRSSTPHSGASGAQPSPVLPMQNASLWPVSETSLDERQQSSVQAQDKKEHQQPQPQQKQEIQLQLREPHTDPSEALNRPEEAIQETTPGAPLPPNGTAAHSATLETAVPTRPRPPTRPRASSNIGNEEGRYNILTPRSTSPTSSISSDMSILERGYRKATAL